MLTQEYTIIDLSHLKAAATWLIEKARGYNFIAFYGDMGAGKTTLIQELCRQSGVIQTVTSPTFAIVNEYNAFEDDVIYHFDFYRLDIPEEVLDIGFEDYVSSGFKCFMEWPEKIEPYLPQVTFKVFISVQSDNSRLIRLEIPDMA